jgi:hypothetical protein
MDDMELLQEYAMRHSEDAFTRLVTRHVDLVYSAALRHTRNHHQAQEINRQGLGGHALRTNNGLLGCQARFLLRVES